MGALRRGRVQARAGDQAGAFETFSAGLRSSPMHPALLCESGWMAFRLGDLQTAKTRLLQGVRAQRVPRRRAACLYNLGRVQESLHEVEDAVSSYERSLRLRPRNSTVEERLASLRPRGSAPRYSRTRDNLEEFCAEADAYGEVRSCSVYADLPLQASEESLVLYLVDWGDARRLSLLLHTQEGSWVRLALLGDEYGGDVSGADFQVDDYGLAQHIPGGPQEFTAEITSSEYDYGEGNMAYYDCEQEGLDEDTCLERMGGAPTFDEGGSHRIACAKLDGRWRCSEFFGGDLPQGEAFAERVRGG